MKVTVAISGATGSIYGIRLLEELKKSGVETSLIISDWGKRTIEYETGYTVAEVEALADSVYANDDLAARVSSGSAEQDAMVVCPCSMKTLSGIANAFNESLIIRAADVTLKERRKLILLARETPLNLSHIENMRTVTLMGGIVLPPVPAFYSKPETIDDIVDQTVFRVLDLLGIPNDNRSRWEGETK